MSNFDIFESYQSFLAKDPEMTMPVAAIESLVTLLRVKKPSTTAEMMKSLIDAVDTLKKETTNVVSVTAGCDLFMRFVARNTHLYTDWDSLSKNLVENAELFVQRAKESRKRIAQIGCDFILDDQVVLVHGYSRAVYNMLALAHSKHKRFKVIVTESRPTTQGGELRDRLRVLGIPVEFIVDSRVASVMNEVDKVFVGAEGVVESGGIINLVGTYSVAIAAQTFGKPLYVAAESHKFVRDFPLSAADLGNKQLLKFDGELEEESVDLTPPNFITALITDLGVLTPSAVSEELIKIWLD